MKATSDVMMSLRRLAIMAGVVGLMLAPLGAASLETRRPAPTHADVSYGPHERNVLDQWLAPSQTPTPLIVFIHGGGYTTGDKDRADSGMIRRCLAAGISFMSINYRYRDHAP